MKLSSFLSIMLLLMISSIFVVTSFSSEPIEIDLVSTATYIVDGDTFDYESGRIRLADINAPDYGETGYDNSKDYLTNLILNKTIWIDVDDLGPLSYGRLICLVYVEHNETHLLNVNKAMVDSDNAEIWDHDNEFDPSLWTYYVEIEYLLSNFRYLFEYNEVKTVYPSNSEPKPLGCGEAMETDWLASAFITSTLVNNTEGLDIEANFVNQTSGKALGVYGCGIVSFGGPFVNPIVKRAENESTPIEDRAPVKFYDEGGYAKFKHWNGDVISGAELPWAHVNDDKDMFVIEMFKDGDGRNMLLCYGFGWKGTYASGKYFNDIIYPDLESYPYSWIIVKWEDKNGNGFVNSESDGDNYIVISHG
jgi:hypothetical protein